MIPQEMPQAILAWRNTTKEIEPNIMTIGKFSCCKDTAFIWLLILERDLYPLFGDLFFAGEHDFFTFEKKANEKGLGCVCVRRTISLRHFPLLSTD